jgi:tRNA A37 N6-isopentenylltransferase MiaA
MIDLTKALFSLYPSAVWTLNGDDYSGLTWMSEDIAKPDEQTLIAECNRLQSEYDSKEYQRKRAIEYPPMTDYLDGIVKGDQAQIDKYIADCLAVKAKYPKG